MNAYFIYNFKRVACHYLIFPKLCFFKYSEVFKLVATIFFCFLKECMNIVWIKNNNRYNISTVKIISWFKNMIKKYIQKLFLSKNYFN